MVKTTLNLSKLKGKQQQNEPLNLVQRKGIDATTLNHPAASEVMSGGNDNKAIALSQTTHGQTLKNVTKQRSICA
jgi:type II secretory pathway component PulM